METIITKERLISEPLVPVTATSDTSRMAMGEPGLPREFLWKGRTVRIAAVHRTWKETGKCTHGSPELYVRKHWYEVETDEHTTMKIYFDRHPRKGKGRKEPRWWLFSVHEPDNESGTDR